MPRSLLALTGHSVLRKTIFVTAPSRIAMTAVTNLRVFVVIDPRICFCHFPCEITRLHDPSRTAVPLQITVVDGGWVTTFALQYTIA